MASREREKAAWTGKMSVIEHTHTHTKEQDRERENKNNWISR